MLDLSSILFSLALVEATMLCALLTFLCSKTKNPGMKEMAGATCAGAIGALVTGFGISFSDYTLVFYGVSFFTISLIFAARSIATILLLSETI